MQEINLIASFLEMSRTEYSLGFIEAGAKSLRHAQEAIAGAGKGLSRIDSIAQRAVFEQRLQELATEINNCKIGKGSLFSALPPNVRRLLIISKRNEPSVPKMVLAGPFHELELPH